MVVIREVDSMARARLAYAPHRFSAIFDYARQPTEATACPLCDRDNPSHPLTDRYGYAIGVSACVCGLSYLNPRMSAASYAQFYEHAYRALVTAWQGPKTNARPLESRQRAYGAGLSVALKVSKCQSGVDLLDVGGGSGVVAESVAQVLPMRSITVLDPNPHELAQAAAKGHQTIPGTAEDLVPIRKYGAILCAQTIDHVRDPMTVLSALRASCEGWLWIDAVEAGWKIDHPLYWTQRALVTALNETGWRVKRDFRYDKNRRLGVIAV